MERPSYALALLLAALAGLMTTMRSANGQWGPVIASTISYGSTTYPLLDEAAFSCPYTHYSLGAHPLHPADAAPADDNLASPSKQDTAGVETDYAELVGELPLTDSLFWFDEVCGAPQAQQPAAAASQTSEEADESLELASAPPASDAAWGTWVGVWRVPAAEGATAADDDAPVYDADFCERYHASLADFADPADNLAPLDAVAGHAYEEWYMADYHAYLNPESPFAVVAPSEVKLKDACSRNVASALLPRVSCNDCCANFLPKMLMEPSASLACKPQLADALAQFECPAGSYAYEYDAELYDWGPSDLEALVEERPTVTSSTTVTTHSLLRLPTTYWTAYQQRLAEWATTDEVRTTVEQSLRSIVTWVESRAEEATEPATEKPVTRADKEELLTDLVGLENKPPVARRRSKELLDSSDLQLLLGVSEGLSQISDAFRQISSHLARYANKELAQRQWTQRR